MWIEGWIDGRTEEDRCIDAWVDEQDRWKRRTDGRMVGRSGLFIIAGCCVVSDVIIEAEVVDCRRVSCHLTIITTMAALTATSDPGDGRSPCPVEIIPPKLSNKVALTTTYMSPEMSIFAGLMNGPATAAAAAQLPLNELSCKFSGFSAAPEP